MHTKQNIASQAMSAVMNKDRAGWLSCFADDAVLRDPVGGSPLDPDGSGLVGRDALGKFWDMVVEPAHHVRFDVREEHCSGRSIARAATVYIDLGGAELSYPGIFVYDLSSSGLIERLCGYFEPPVLD